MEELQTKISANSKERQRLTKRNRTVKAKKERAQAKLLGSVTVKIRRSLSAYNCFKGSNRQGF